MTWVQIVIGAIALARELLKFLQDEQKCKKDTAKELKEMRLALRRMREQGKTDDVEKLFRDLRLHYSDNSTDGGMHNT